MVKSKYKYVCQYQTFSQIPFELNDSILTKYLPVDRWHSQNKFLSLSTIPNLRSTPQDIYLQYLNMVILFIAGYLSPPTNILAGSIFPHKHIRYKYEVMVSFVINKTCCSCIFFFFPPICLGIFAVEKKVFKIVWNGVNFNEMFLKNLLILYHWYLWCPVGELHIWREKKLWSDYHAHTQRVGDIVDTYGGKVRFIVFFGVLPMVEALQQL